MRFLAFDLETTGLDVNSCEIIELGFAYYDSEISQAPIITRDYICETEAPISDEITAITGISPKLQKMAAVPLRESIADMVEIAQKYDAEYLVAHNGLEYDMPVIERAMRIQSIPAKLPKCIDTKIDLPFKKVYKSMSLVFLNAEHGFLNPFPHRALFDAMSCAKLMMMYDLEEVARSANTPLIEVRADVKYEGREQAKKAGYNWDGDRKIWFKKMREIKFNEEQVCRNFPVILLRK